MEQLYEVANINNQKLKNLVNRITASELTKLSEPCYYPELRKYYYELLRSCGLSDKIMKGFVKRFYKGTPAAKWQLQRDPQSNLYIFIMNYFLKRRDIRSFSTMMTLFIIRYYTNRIRIHIKYCNKDVFRYTLEHMTKTHLFSREKSISGALFFISKDMQKKYKNDILEANPMDISKFIQASRHRVAQSVRSFAELYYKSSHEGQRMGNLPEKTDEENEYQIQNIERTSKIVDTVVKKITVYKVVDLKAMNEAKNITKISSLMASDLSGTLNDSKYMDNIKIILDLFLKDVKDVGTICGDAYYPYIKSLMSVKRTSMRIYFKQQVEVLLMKILTDMDYKDKFNKLTSQTQFLIKSYIGYYITLVLRNTVC